MSIALPKEFYFKQGKKAVLLLHAYSGSSNDMRMLGRYLETQNYSVYAPIFSGHGTLNPEDLFTYSPDVWWQDTQQALSFLKNQGHEQVAVFGLSMGGIFALRALEENKKGILGGGAFCSPVIPEAKTEVVSNFLLYSKKVLEVAGDSELQISEKIERIKPQVEKQLKTILAFSDQTSALLSAIICPVFLAQAGKDEMIDPNVVFAMEKALTRTKAEVCWYPESGHAVTVGKEHKKLEQDVAAFLKKLPWNEEDA